MVPAAAAPLETMTPFFEQHPPTGTTTYATPAVLQPPIFTNNNDANTGRPPGAPDSSEFNPMSYRQPLSGLAARRAFGCRPRVSSVGLAITAEAWEHVKANWC